MHETAKRLFEAMRILSGIDGSTEPGRAAAFLGESAATITNWKSRGVSKQGMLKANALLGVSPHWISTGDGEMGPSITTSNIKISAGSGQANPLAPLSSPSDQALRNDKFAKNEAKLIPAGDVTRGRLVPVVGMARLGDNGFYEEISPISGAGDGMVEAYSNDPDAYALRVRGDSMFPAIRDGWFVIVEPSSAPTPGDYVLIKLKSGQKMVKELIMQRPDGITVVSVNGDLRRTIEAQEIDAHFGIQSVGAIVSPRKWIPC